MSDRGATVFYGTRNLYPGDDPREHGLQKAELVELTPNCLHVVVSPLLGYGLSLLRERLPPRSLLITIEINQDFDAFTIVQEGVSHFSAESPFHIEQLGHGLRSIRSIRLISLNGARVIFAEAYKALEGRLNDELLAWWRNRSTLLYHGRRWVRNIIENTVTILANTVNPQVSRQLGEGKDGVVFCAAGPSLEMNLHDLQLYQDRLIIMCADTALSSLLAAGIRPDICIVLEGQWHNLDDFTVLPLPPKMEVWADLTSHGPTLRYLQRKGLECRFFSSAFTPSILLSTIAHDLALPIIPALGSVGVCGIYLAGLVAAEHTLPLFLAGTDFKTSPGKSHARASPAHLRGLRTLRRERPHPWHESSWHNEKNAVLDSYGALATDYICKLTKSYHIEIYDIRTTGRSLGISAPITLAAWFQEHHSTHQPPTGKVAIWSQVPASGSIVALIESELGALQSACIQLLSKQNLQLEDWEDVHYGLERLDLLFIDFPDIEWPPVISEAIARILVRINEVRELLDQYQSSSPVFNTERKAL